jgi:hypothetical protein
MRFQIFGDKIKIKEFLDEFIKLAEEEFKVQMDKTKNMPLPFGISIPDMLFSMGYLEEPDSIIFYNSLPFPKTLWLLKKKITGKMETNLKEFFKAKEVNVDIKYLGD